LQSSRGFEDKQEWNKSRSRKHGWQGRAASTH